MSSGFSLALPCSCQCVTVSFLLQSPYRSVEVMKRSRREKASCPSGTSLADSVLCLSVELKKKLSLRLLTRGRGSAAGSPLRGSILCRPLRNSCLAKNVTHQRDDDLSHSARVPQSAAAVSGSRPKIGDVVGHTVDLLRHDTCSCDGTWRPPNLDPDQMRRSARVKGCTLTSRA